MELIFKKLFKKNSLKLIRGNVKLKEKINLVIYDFSINLFKSIYYRKQLKNIGNNIHELQIGGDIRIIVEVIVLDNVIIFLNIGTHSSLELSSDKKIKL
ncbi:MAG: hypothetical protein PHS49_06630 [Candidatus Gracilibacteria bacterium]|nr:hypothetical protein [Candidatus Gracilibacteria bacterium]